MFVIWPVVISMTLGVLCGSWIPLFHFVIVALVETFGSALVVWLSGHDMLIASHGLMLQTANIWSTVLMILALTLSSFPRALLRLVGPRNSCGSLPALAHHVLLT